MAGRYSDLGFIISCVRCGLDSKLWAVAMKGRKLCYEITQIVQ